MTETTSEDVLGLFCTTESTQKRFNDWRTDPRRTEVVPMVMAHRTRALYDLTEDDVRHVCETTEHALGDVRRQVGESVREVVDWHPNFAFTHTFHICVERLGYVPTYQRFREFAFSDSDGRKMLGGPATALVRDLVAGGKYPEWVVRAAMRWRVGNAYYGFLREIYTFVHLKVRGVNLCFHPLADALFRVDAWAGRRALSLRVGNKKFRQGMNAGRKTPAEQLLADVLPRLQFDTIELAAATRFGVVHVPSAEQLDRAAARLLAGYNS